MQFVDYLFSLMTVENAWKFTLGGFLMFFLAFLIEWFRYKDIKGGPNNISSDPTELSPDISSGLANQDYKLSSFGLDAKTTSLENAGIVSKTERTAETNKNRTNETVLLSDKLKRTRKSFWSGLKSVFSNAEDAGKLTDEILVSFEELLIESDLGVKTSTRLISEIKEELHDKVVSARSVEICLRHRIRDILHSENDPDIEPRKVSGLPKIILVVGVNGAGKTTSIGKLAFQYQAQGAKVLIAACDTFRAAAAGQLDIWKERAGAQIEKGAEGEKPATVAYRAVHRARDENFDVLLIDTAGRLHTRVNLMNELSGILGIISREQPGAPHETILVVDGSSGQNALQQAREFNSATKLSGIIITKLDGTPKGGIVVAIKDELGVPVRYIGLGESVADLRPFYADEFVDALFGSEGIREKTQLSQSQTAIG